MAKILRRADLGFRDFGWLKARHHFSFGDYYNRERMGLGVLRVWNDDEIAPHKGFDPHPHKNMEIVTFIRQGAITHQDSMGNEGKTAVNEIQVMRAGDGIVHSEFNLEDETTRLFQIWFTPRAAGGKPGWENRSFPNHKDGNFTIVATGFLEEKGMDNAVWMDADASLKAGKFLENTSLSLPSIHGLARYLVVDQGEMLWEDQMLSSGDALKMNEDEGVELIMKLPTSLVMAELLV